MKQESPTGWKCPCCSTVYSPAVTSCACQKPDTTEQEWERLKKRVQRDVAPSDWERLMQIWKEHQAKRPKYPQPPLEFHPRPPTLFSLDPTCSYSR